MMTQRIRTALTIGLTAMILRTPSTGAADHSLDAADGSPTGVVYVDAEGNVGIGTKTPMEKLDVSGTIKAVGTVSAPIGDMQVSVPTAWGYLGDGVHGVYGRAITEDGLGIFGLAERGANVGVKGVAANDGDVTNNGGVFIAEGQTGRGVYGQANGSQGKGVQGYASSTSDEAHYGGFFVAQGKNGRGVYGQANGSQGRGVQGYASHTGDESHYGGFFSAAGAYGRGVQGEAFGAHGIGVYAKGGAVALAARASEGGVAGDFIGNVRIRSMTDASIVIELGEGLDYAEGFDVSTEREVGPGTVLAIDPHNPGELRISDRAYDTKVAGIVAGAKGLGSGVRLGASGYDHDVALAGRVYCNVDATEAGVEPGDLLTTSSTPGYAMKAIHYARAQGAVLGKAMEMLEKGRKGQILVLVTLQ